MIGMQYKIKFPKDYDMGIIKKRVTDNGHKTDGFPGLLFKAYLITETEESGNFYNSYAPLYIWNDSEGMNKFIFGGFYDNILGSFGWQQINMGVPYSINLDKEFNRSKYVVEVKGNIPESKSLANRDFLPFQHLVENSLGNVLIYNPDKWSYSNFFFYERKPELSPTDDITIYEILHISQ
ncbi:DUF4865 family protein [Neobacillus sp. LXY-1]|uniref:DUF4865 family protein n=1 Tax=Neobacillus sp. LXY-1 TaxID=3379133 RepID=UPI003EDED3F7